MYVHSEALLRNTLSPKGFLKFRARMEHRISEIMREMDNFVGTWKEISST